LLLKSAALRDICLYFFGAAPWGKWVMKLSTLFIGILQVFVAGIFGFLTWNGLVNVGKSTTWVVYVGLAMGFFAMLLNLIAGVLLLTTKRKAGYILSIINTALQVPIINVPGLFYLYSGLGQLFIGASTEGLTFGANIAPGRFFLNNIPNGLPSIAINLVALAFVFFLLEALRTLRANRQHEQSRFDPYRQ
jgi:hypothetical protein